MDRALQTWGVDQGWAANTWVIFVPWCRTAVRGYQDDQQPLLSHSPAEGEWDEEGEKHKAASLDVDNSSTTVTNSVSNFKVEKDESLENKTMEISE